MANLSFISLAIFQNTVKHNDFLKAWSIEKAEE